MDSFSRGRLERCCTLSRSQPAASHKPASRALCASLPGVPGVPGVPDVPGVPGVPDVPGVPGIPQALRPPAPVLLAVEGRLEFMHETC